ncbi:hypothetical protein NDU88_002572 [Pleurodeles waltl]|uniref:Uncharacterized protein n=1 Tax=Pleurodeles waltl TaxID=8319 RepID=A0AAV7Q7C6_PLEWA|nr:hypothetical protein NDU88_002572 [Pleurodeles waltl]
MRVPAWLLLPVRPTSSTPFLGALEVGETVQGSQRPRAAQAPSGGERSRGALMAQISGKESGALLIEHSWDFAGDGAFEIGA